MLSRLFFLGLIVVQLVPAISHASVVMEVSPCVAVFEKVGSEEYKILLIKAQQVEAWLGENYSDKDCQQTLESISKKGVGDTETFSTFDMQGHGTGATYFQVPFQSFSSMGSEGAVSGIHYDFYSLQVLNTNPVTVEPLKKEVTVTSPVKKVETPVVVPVTKKVDVPVTIEKEVSDEDTFVPVDITPVTLPLVADDQPPITFTDSILYNLWYRFMSWFR